jgi:hypothetical protein
MKVSERALYARINRALKREEQMLRTARKYDPSVGRYYLIDANRNILLDTHVDLEALGRELGVRGSQEQLSTTA